MVARPEALGVAPTGRVCDFCPAACRRVVCHPSAPLRARLARPPVAASASAAVWPLDLSVCILCLRECVAAFQAFRFAQKHKRAKTRRQAANSCFEPLIWAHLNTRRAAYSSARRRIVVAVVGRQRNARDVLLAAERMRDLRGRRRNCPAARAEGSSSHLQPAHCSLIGPLLTEARARQANELIQPGGKRNRRRSLGAPSSSRPSLSPDLIGGPETSARQLVRFIWRTGEPIWSAFCFARPTEARKLILVASLCCCCRRRRRRARARPCKVLDDPPAPGEAKIRSRPYWTSADPSEWSSSLKL